MKSPIEQLYEDVGERLNITSSDFLRKKDNAGLIRVLKIIQEAGKDGISTTKLCEQAFRTRNYGMRVINRACDEGYIKRFGKNKPSYSSFFLSYTNLRF